MTPLSGNMDSIYQHETPLWALIVDASRPTKSTVHLVEESGAMQQLTCALVVNAKQFREMSTAAHRPSLRGRGQTGPRGLHNYNSKKIIT